MSSGHLGLVAKTADYFLRSRLTVLLVVVASLFGLFAIFATPREENPQISVPFAVVNTTYAGADRDQVERLVSKPVERMLQEIPGVEHLYTTTTEGLSSITVRFKVGEDKTKSYVDLYNQLLAGRQALPQGAGDPLVQPLDVDDVPIVVLTISGARYDDVQLRLLAHRILDAVQPVKDVGVVSIFGGRERIVSVLLDPARLAGSALSPQDIERALGVTNVERRTGYVSSAGQRLLLHTGTPFTQPQQVAAQIVAVRDGRPISLRDVADVSMGAAPQEWATDQYTSSSAGGSTAVSVAVAKKQGSNAVAVARDVIAASQRVLLPPGVALTVTRDDGAKADAAVNELIRRLVEGIAIIVALLLLALGWREALVVALAIPLTLFVTLGVGMLAHQTINRITLFALILALGLLVDDAIVVVENIHRHLRRQPKDARGAVVAAVNEIANPTILATLAVILAFVPMAFVTGMMGPYMRPIPFNVPIAMLVSLGVAVIVTPWPARRLLSANEKPASRPPAPAVWESFYRRLLGRLLDDARMRSRFFSLLALALAVALALPMAALVKFRMLPQQNENTFLVTVDAPSGTDLSTTQTIVGSLARRVMMDPNVHDVETFAGTHSVPDFNSLLQGLIFRDAPWQADMRVNLTPKDERHSSSPDIANGLRGPLQRIGERYGALVKIVQEPPGPPVRATVLARVYADNPSVRSEAVSQLKSMLAREPGAVDVDSSVKAQPARVQLTVDARKAALAGISPSDVADDVSIAYEGAAVTTLHDPKAPDPPTVFLRYSPQYRSGMESFSSIWLPSPAAAGTGGGVPLSSLVVATTGLEQQPAYREDGTSVDYVSAEMAGRSSTYAVIDMVVALMRHPLPAGASVSWDGEWKLTLDVFRDLGSAMAVAVLLIYLLLVAWFRSFAVPLVVMAAIPLGLIGVMPGFALLAPAGVYFSATAMIGVIALAGIVVRNSIVLVEFIEDELRAGIPLREALIRAGLTRARPIALTAAAGVLSSVVIAGDPVWSGLAWALVFGMSASAMLSLLAVPVLYGLVARFDPLAHRSMHVDASTDAA
jgi:multidrug efflux pump subunit AcrB